MQQTLAALVENKPGVLNRVVSLFRQRNFNIDSLTVGRTENPDISRMTIVVDREPEQIKKHLQKLVNVIQVEQLTGMPDVSRDLALIKVRVDSQTRTEVAQLCEIFRANIVDATPEAVIVQIVGDDQKINSMINLLRDIGIMEMVRTGIVSMTRGEHVLSPNGYKARNGSNGKSNGSQPNPL